jgi:hypothetical protein
MERRVHQGLRPALAAALLAVALAGCSASARVGDRLTLQGTFVLKGNEPVVTPVLVRSASQQWELQEVPRTSWVGLQNRTVQATGVVTRPESQALRPALRVTELKAQP